MGSFFLGNKIAIMEQCRPMHTRTILAATLLLAALPSHSKAQHIAAAIESTLTVSGAGIPSETYRLAQVYGDWFVTATDAHASLTMRTLPGAHQAQLGIGWDGKGTTQTIDAANSDVHSQSGFQFSLHLTGAGPYSQSAQLRGSDAITVTITKMDSLTLEATFSGSATGAGPLAISGVIKLHRAATAEKPTGTFGNCDPQIYDRLAGAEWRSPSDCEVKFDAYVRKGLTVALQPAIDNLTAQGWNVTSAVEAQSLTSIPRHTEDKPFQMTEQQNHQGGAFYVSLALDKSSPIYQQYDSKVQAAMQQMADQMKAGVASVTKATTDALHDAVKEQEEHTTLHIGIAINAASTGIAIFKGGHTVTQLPTGGFMVSAPYVQPPGGGGEDGAQRVTYVFLGSFTPPAAAASSGPENVQVKATLNNARLLSVQTIRIRIQSGTDLAQQVIKLIDWSAMQNLMAGK
jgi:hypothetical protein